MGITLTDLLQVKKSKFLLFQIVSTDLHVILAYLDMTRYPQ